ncbi:MAG: GNAT family N-acetyltransferase [Alphaproteobacteria bacterium]|nr:GNAT family N-acetyltransferase [Alphaproteobacteria bacterium]
MIFDSKITGQLLDLQLDFKAPNVAETDKDVKKARVFADLLKRNVSRLRLLPDFATIKGVIQVRETMNEWREKANNGDSATYYMYPKGTDTCVGCVRLKTAGQMVETAFWTAEEATGKGYMQDAAKAVEKMLFSNGAQEIVRRVYLQNPCHDAVKHNIEKAGYVPCAFKGVSYKKGDEKVFETFHKTIQMYQDKKEIPFSLLTKQSKGRR